MVGGGGLADVLYSRRVATRAVAQPRRTPRFVERDPSFDVVTEGSSDDVDVLGETLGGIAHAPAALVLQWLGQVPVVEGERGLDVALAQTIDQSAVEVQATLI